MAFLQHLRTRSSLAGDIADEGRRSRGSRFLKKKSVPPETPSRKSSKFGSQHQQPVPHVRSSQTAALSRLSDLESRIQSHKQAGHLLKPALDLRSSPAASDTPDTADLHEPFRLSPLSSDEPSPKGRRFLKSNRAACVKTSQPDVLGIGIGPIPGDADGAVPLAGTDTRQVAAVSLESDEEDIRKLLGDSLNSITPAKPRCYKTADEVF